MVNERLRHHRLLRGWTLDGVADRLDQLAPTVGKKHLGVTGAMVGKWERGVQQPRGIYRELLCVLYDTTADELGRSSRREWCSKAGGPDVTSATASLMIVGLFHGSTKETPRWPRATG